MSEENKALDLPNMPAQKSGKAVAAVGFPEVKNWKPLLAQHEAALQGPTLEIKYEITCCQCHQTRTTKRLDACNCQRPGDPQHTCCDKCKVVEKNNMSAVMDPVLRKDLAELEARKQFLTNEIRVSEMTLCYASTIPEQQRVHQLRVDIDSVQRAIAVVKGKLGRQSE